MSKVIVPIDFKKDLGDDWIIEPNLVEYVEKLYRDAIKTNPFVEVHARVKHTRNDEGQRDVREIYGQIVYVEDDAFLLGNNPWRHQKYYGSFYSYLKENLNWLLPEQFIKKEFLPEKHFLWVYAENTISLELHFPTDTNKIAAKTLTQLNLTE